jgi:hypothetical protein
MLRSEWRTSARSWMDLNLVDPFQLILDRILGGDDLDVRAVDLDQRTVERRGLSRTGRAGDQDDAVRQFDQLGRTWRTCRAPSPAASARRPSTPCPGYAGRCLSPWIIGITETRISTSRPRTFSLIRPSCGSAFGDVQPGHDLQAADDRRLKAIDLRRRRLRLEHPVDAIADHQPRGCDSMCTSLARVSIASSRISFTSRMTDASWAISESSEPSGRDRPAVRRHRPIPSGRSGPRPSRCPRPSAS